MGPVVGIGELLWDIYPDGRKVAGGAPFNFAFHCHQLGHPAVIATRVGNDDLGRELRDEVRCRGMSDEYIQTDPDRPTGTVQVRLDAAGVPTYQIMPDTAWGRIEWTNPLADLIRRSAAVCHGTLGLNPAVQKAAGLRTTRGKRDGLTVYDVNLRPGLAVAAAAVWTARWIKVNEEELAGFEDVIDNDMDDDPWPRSLDSLVRYWNGPRAAPTKMLLITRGAAGVEIVTGDGARHQYPGAYARVVDTVGAGDAFTAAVVCMHLEGRPLAESARFAVRYAARVCEHHGATPTIPRAEVERAAFGSAWGRS